MKAMKNPHFREVENLLRTGSQKLRQDLTAEALDCFQRAYRQAIKLADAAVIRSCAFDLGAAMVTVGQYDKAVRYLQLVLPSDKSEKPVPYLADVHFNIGVAQEKLNDIVASQESYRHAFAYYKKNGMYQMQVEVAFKIARYSESEGDIQDARAFYRAAMEACQDDPTMAEWRLRSQVKFAYFSCLLEDVGPVEELARCQPDAHMIPSAEHRTAMLNEMGITLMHGKQFVAARDCFLAGLHCVPPASADPNFQRAAFLQNAASALTALDQFELAVARYIEAARLYDRPENPNRLGQGHCYLNAALCHTRMAGEDHLTAARELYASSLRCAREADDRTAQSESLEALGAMEFNAGNNLEAAAHFKEALAMADDKRDEAKHRIAEKLQLTQVCLEQEQQQLTSSGHITTQQTGSLQASPHHQTATAGPLEQPAAIDAGDAEAQDEDTAVAASLDEALKIVPVASSSELVENSTEEAVQASKSQRASADFSEPGSSSCCSSCCSSPCCSSAGQQHVAEAAVSSTRPGGGTDQLTLATDAQSHGDATSQSSASIRAAFQSSEQLGRRPRSPSQSEAMRRPSLSLRGDNEPKQTAQGPGADLAPVGDRARRDSYGSCSSCSSYTSSYTSYASSSAAATFRPDDDAGALDSRQQAGQNAADLLMPADPEAATIGSTRREL